MRGLRIVAIGFRTTENRSQQSVPFPRPFPFSWVSCISTWPGMMAPAYMLFFLFPALGGELAKSYTKLDGRTVLGTG